MSTMKTNIPITSIEKDTIIFQKKYYFMPTIHRVWTRVTFLITLNILWLYGYYVIISQKVWITMVFATLYGELGLLGITAGAHRLWSHKSYKARVPLRIFLMLAQTIAGQKSIYTWSRDHRVHHKFSDTDADPHNVRRGFFFAHIGWQISKRHPEQLIKGRSLNYDDLINDPVVAVQYKYYNQLVTIFGIIIPTIIPIIFWNETLINSLIINIFRYTLILHVTFFVNSAAHMFGDRPYDVAIKPAENVFVSFAALGEGYHNFHHTFPFDYATGELGGKLNFTKKFIDVMAFTGLAFDLKTASDGSIANRKEKNNNNIVSMKM